MSILSLFDIASLTFEAQEPESKSGREASARLLLVAVSMVATLNEQFKKIEQLDEAYAPSVGPAEDGALDVGSATALRAMYEEATRDAERVFTRIERLERHGQKIEGAQELRDFYRRAKAMLSVSLADIADSLNDIRQGNVISGEEVRRGISSRIHA